MTSFKVLGSGGFRALFSRANGILLEIVSVNKLKRCLIIANIFKLIFPKIIAQEQVDFMEGRNISDNIIIAQEVIHSMKYIKEEVDGD